MAHLPLAAKQIRPPTKYLKTDSRNCLNMVNKSQLKLMLSPFNKETIDVDYLKVCPLILDWRSSLLGHKSNPGPHVL